MKNIKQVQSIILYIYNNYAMNSKLIIINLTIFNEKQMI